VALGEPDTAGDDHDVRRRSQAGQSFVTLAIAAAVSRGRPLPQSDLPDRPASTILISAEDDPARTIVPRLVAAGADLSRIHVLESIKLANGLEALPSLRADIDAISAAAARLGDCRLIVIDPVAAYLNGVDDNRNSALRRVLSPLKNLAERMRAAVVLVSHLTKAAARSGKHRIIGSIAYLGACRASFLFVPDPRDPTGRRVLMFDNGGNAAPLSPTLAYTIEDPGGRGPLVVWSDEPVTIAIDEALRPRRQPPAERQDPELTDCEQWLRETLAAAGGRMLAGQIRRAGQEAGFPWRTIQYARPRVSVTTVREGFGPGSKVYWQLGEG
jgi:putative DNA primase/helicase